MWYIGKRPCCADGMHGAFDCLSSRNSRLRGGLEVIQLYHVYNDAFEDEAGHEFDRE